MMKFILVLCVGLFALSLVAAQEKQVVKERAESELQKATPEQIKAKIKELGMTQDEAEAKAKQLGIDLQQYLQIQGGAQQAEPGQQLQVPQPEEAQKKKEEIKPAEVPTALTTVPGFEGRAGAAGLHAFGYNIFSYPSSTFEPVLNIPTPVNYVLGPGDEVLLTLWGETQLFHQLTVNREGNIVVPGVGPVLAQGATIESLKLRLLRRLTSFYSGLRNGQSNANTWLDVSLGKLRTIQIFVLGEVNKPGGYMVSSMSTAFLGLYVSGGPHLGGSLRQIQVLRADKVAATMDLYDYIVRGDNSKDIRLQDRDIIFVKVVGKRVALAGSVVRPAIYELKPNETLSDLLAFAGELQFDAYSDRVHIERVIPFDQRKEYAKNILDIDLRFTSKDELLRSSFKLEDGDVVSILRINEFPQNRVTISGNVKKPGVFALRKGMTIRDIVQEADGLLSDTFEDRGNLIRVLPNMRKELVPFNLASAMQGDTTNNFALQADDAVMIYKQGYFFPEHSVAVSGAVRRPGTYLRAENMSVADLVVLAGGLTEGASLEDWELSQIDSSGAGRLSKVYKFTTERNFWEDGKLRSFMVRDFDHLSIPFDPKFNPQRVVEVRGYVMAAGTYVIRYEGEKLASIISRAGGLRQGAYLQGATLTRSWNNYGLVPIDFEKALSDTASIQNPVVLDGDVVNIPFKQDVVAVKGEVFVPSSVVYQKGKSLSYYIRQAGGFTDNADDGRVVVTLPNGTKWEPSWFIFPNPDIPGGSAIFVPRKIEKEDKTLPILRDWVTIMASLATMAIAIVQITR